MRNSIRNINRLYNVAYYSMCTTRGTLSYDRVTDCITKLAVMCAETETDEFTFSEIGGFKEFTLGDLIMGAFWHYTEYHRGQDSKEYVALSALGDLFSPGMASGPESDTGEDYAYTTLAEIAEAALVLNFKGIQ